LQIVAIDDQVLFYIENVDIMRNFKYIVITMMCALCGVRGMAQDTLRTEVLPTWESLNQRGYPQWFSDAKLGIFIH
jgi:hypothetical protein